MKNNTLIIIGIITIVAVSIISISLVYNQEIKLAAGMMTSDEQPQPTQVINESLVLGFTDGVTEIINPEHEPLEYRITSQVINDTYLSKNVQQWQDV